MPTTTTTTSPSPDYTPEEVEFLLRVHAWIKEKPGPTSTYREVFRFLRDDHERPSGDAGR